MNKKNHNSLHMLWL